MKSTYHHLTTHQAEPLKSSDKIPLNQQTKSTYHHLATHQAGPLKSFDKIYKIHISSPDNSLGRTHEREFHNQSTYHQTKSTYHHLLIRQSRCRQTPQSAQTPLKSSDEIHISSDNSSDKTHERDFHTKETSTINPHIIRQNKQSAQRQTPTLT